MLVAVEKRGRASGRARMSVIADFKASTIVPFLTRNVAPGATIITDGLKSFSGLTEAGFKHVVRIQPLRSDNEVTPAIRINPAVSLGAAWLSCT